MKKLNLKKVLIPSFALLIGGSLAATLSSTLAWFQYATRAQVAYVGALTHSTKLLKISIDNGGHWGNDYYQDDMAKPGVIRGNHLVPITTGEQAKDAALTNFYAQPEFGVGGTYNSWTPAGANDYAQFTILAKVTDVDGANSPTALENDVYITELFIKDDSTNGTTNDLSDAVRVHIAVTDAGNNKKNFLFAKSVTSTAVGGKLDLNNDGHYDKDLDSWGTQDCYYGVENGVQTSYLYNDTTIISANQDNPTGVSIGKTGANNMTIVVTTWIEGWSKLDQGETGNANGASDTPVWDPAAYVGKKFNVGIRLGVKSHNSDHQN